MKLRYSHGISKYENVIKWKTVTTPPPFPTFIYVYAGFFFCKINSVENKYATLHLTGNKFSERKFIFNHKTL